MYTYFDNFFVKLHCGFRKCYCLLVMIEKMKEARDKLFLVFLKAQY